MSWRQFINWIAFWNLEPWGNDWQRTANLGALLIRPYLKERADFPPENLMPNGGRRKLLEPDELGDNILACFQAMGAEPASNPWLSSK